jgi:hypothetical protein
LKLELFEGCTITGSEWEKPMNPVYESTIEVAIVEAAPKPRGQDELIMDIRMSGILGMFRELRLHVADIFRHVRCTPCKGKYGYASSYCNCDFAHLYEVFGVDILGFLFGHHWVPYRVVDPFDPDSFLARLAVLERALAGIGIGDQLPVLVVETVAFRWSSYSSSTGTANFRTEDLKDSIRELKDFGKLGQRMRDRGQKVTVEVKVLSSEFKYPPDILFFSNRNQERGRELLGLVQ